MKRIPNRDILIARQAALMDLTDAALFESIHDAIVTSLEGGAINPGEVLYDNWKVSVSLAVEQRLRHCFNREGYQLHFEVYGIDHTRTLIRIDGPKVSRTPVIPQPQPR